MNRRLLSLVAVAPLCLAACHATPPAPDQQQGANPALPEAEQYLFPPMKITTPVGWKNGETPTVPSGFTITAFATDLHGPRNILPLPNGDVLAVEAGGPSGAPVTRPKDIIYGLVIGKAHSPVKPGNRVVLLRDVNGDGRADQRTILIDKLNSPFGITLVGNALYVAETDKIMRYAFTPGQTSIAGPGTVVTLLPAGEINHHWTKSLTASPDGSKLYVGIGSNSNITERGMGAELERARIWEIDPATGAHRPYATGLRNPNGLTFEPVTQKLWAVVNERDEIGQNLVPDYMTSVQPGGFYGWPWSYYGNHVDIRVMPRQPNMVAKAISPDFALGPHVAALGLAFNSGSAFPAHYAGGAFVGEHGSWDRDVLNGYQVAFVPFANGKPAGKVEPFVTGFLDKGNTRGRPVSVAFDRSGALLIADDVGNAVWRVTANGQSTIAGGAAPPASLALRSPRPR
jgi:glucose/arabinose dehydrogenase